MSNYKDLQAWKMSIGLVLDIYRLVKEFPSEERYALGDQMRRAVVSVPSNIAEGHARGSKKEFAHFLSIAIGSLAELETQLVICQKLDYCTLERYNNITNTLDEVTRMLVGLRKSLVP